MAKHRSEEPARLDANTQPDALRLARGWLALGVLALALAGIFAILLVLARSPGLAWLFPTQGFFRTALVVHVDQSILIWFLAFAGVLWGLAPGTHPAFSRFGLAAAAIGCILVAASAFLGAATPPTHSPTLSIYLQPPLTPNETKRNETRPRTMYCQSPP